jgi:predicted nucleic acid-binding protein
MAYLLDTSVLAELRKQTCNLGVVEWMSSIEPDEIHLSALTIGELRFGIELRRREGPKTVAALERWLLGLERDYAERILPITAAIADRWGRLSVDKPLPIAEGLIAATGIEHKLVVVTDNPDAFRRSGVNTFNPFS